MHIWYRFTLQVFLYSWGVTSHQELVMYAGTSALTFHVILQCLQLWSSSVLFSFCLLLIVIFQSADSKMLNFLKQVDLALDEILHLQKEGPTDEDISSILEIEQRAHENGLQVCLKIIS